MVCRMAQGRETRAAAIRVARALHRLNQNDVARIAGLDQSTVSKAEAGRASDATYDAIDQALDTLEAAS